MTGDERVSTSVHDKLCSMDTADTSTHHVLLTSVVTGTHHVSIDECGEEGYQLVECELPKLVLREAPLLGHLCLRHPGALLLHEPQDGLLEVGA